MRRVASFFFLATLFCCTFEKVHWSVPGAGDVNVADLLALVFLGAFAILSRPRVPRTTAIVLVFFAALPDRLPASASTTWRRTRRCRNTSRGW